MTTGAPLADLVLSLGSRSRTPLPDDVSSALLGLAGVARVHLDAHGTWAIVSHRPGPTTTEEIVTELTRLGFVVLGAQLFTDG